MKSASKKVEKNSNIEASIQGPLMVYRKKTAAEIKEITEYIAQRKAQIKTAKK